MIIIAVIAALIILSKKKEEEHVAPMDYDPEITPTMYTTDATSYVSDSGYTRYYIETTQWYIFDEAREPNWKFPEGLYGEKFDNDMNVVSTFECDSAIYLSSPKLWELIGNVRINSEGGDRFLTQHLFWDTSRHKMYSDSFIHIEKSDRIIEGYGFISDERITDYVVNRPSMIIPADELSRDRTTAAADSASPALPDTMATGEPRRRPPRPREGYAPLPLTTSATPSAPTPAGHVPGSHNAARHGQTTSVPPIPATPPANPGAVPTPSERKRSVTEAPTAPQTIRSAQPLKATSLKSK